MNHITDDMLRELYIEITSYCLNLNTSWEVARPYHIWTYNIIDIARERGMKHDVTWPWLQIAKKKAGVK